MNFTGKAKHAINLQTESDALTLKAILIQYCLLCKWTQEQIDPHYASGQGRECHMCSTHWGISVVSTLYVYQQIFLIW